MSHKILQLPVYYVFPDQLNSDQIINPMTDICTTKYENLS